MRAVLSFIACSFRLEAMLKYVSAHERLLSQGKLGTALHEPRGIGGRTLSTQSALESHNVNLHQQLRGN